MEGYYELDNINKNIFSLFVLYFMIFGSSNSPSTGLEAAWGGGLLCPFDMSSSFFHHLLSSSWNKVILGFSYTFCTPDLKSAFSSQDSILILIFAADNLTSATL